MPANKRSYNSPPAMGGDATKRVRFGSEDDGVDDSVEWALTIYYLNTLNLRP